MSAFLVAILQGVFARLPSTATRKQRFLWYPSLRISNGHHAILAIQATTLADLPKPSLEEPIVMEGAPPTPAGLWLQLPICQDQVGEQGSNAHLACSADPCLSSRRSVLGLIETLLQA